VEHACQQHSISERHACRLVNQWRATQRYQPLHRTDEDALSAAIIQLASEYGRYGYRRITALLQEAGWQVGKDRVQRIWRREGLKVPQNKDHEEGCGSTTARAFGCGRRGRITCGATIS
jgi:putative transposase